MLIIIIIIVVVVVVVIIIITVPVKDTFKPVQFLGPDTCAVKKYLHPPQEWSEGKGVLNSLNS